MKYALNWCSRLVFLLCITIFLSNDCFSQNGVTRYALPTGFAPGTLSYKTDLEIDHQNRVWVGFRTIGIGVFDGAGWKVYNDTNSLLPSNKILCIGIDYVNRVWIGTPNGLVTFDGSNWSLYNMLNSILPNDSIISIYCHGKNTWIGTTNGCVKYDGTGWVHFTSGNSGLANDTVLAFVEDNAGNCWIGTKNGLSFFSNNSWVNYDSTNSGLKHQTIIALAINTRNELFLSASPYALYYYSDSIFYNYQEEIYEDAITFYFSHKLFPGINTGCLKINKNGNLVFISNTIWEIDQSHGEIYHTSIYSSHTANQFDLDQQGLLWFAKDSSLYSFDSDLYSNYGKGLDNTNTKNLDCNNVKAMMLNRGDMCWDLQNSRYEVPNGSGINSIFASALWFGGLDSSNQLHIAAQTYRLSGEEFWPGPIDTLSGIADSFSCRPYDKIWKVSRFEIEELKYHFLKGDLSTGDFQIPEDILTWPVHGTGNISGQLAPFIDADSNGIYNPNMGDYPSIPGDQALFWIFNDNLGTHTQTGGLPLGLECHVMAYAFNCPEIQDTMEVINNTIFLRYKFINRSHNEYHQCYAALFVDTDLGINTDDYIGCDTLLQAGFTYNGDDEDGIFGGYGLHPPIQNVILLKGPEAEPNDGLDNDKDGIVDEIPENNYLSNFMTYFGGNNTPAGDPTVDHEFYFYMKSKWLDGSQLTYGGNGLTFSNIPTNFIFSGTPYDTIGWTEFNSGNFPEDRHFIVSSGPFSISSGEIKSLDVAFVWTRDSLQPNGLTTSIARNKSDLKSILDMFNNNSFPTCIQYEFPPLPEPATVVQVFPNPVLDFLEIPSDFSGKEKEIKIYDMTGRLCFQIRTFQQSIYVKSLAKGYYSIQILQTDNSYTTKFCKM